MSLLRSVSRMEKAPPFDPRFVVALQRSTGDRLFLHDPYGDAWSGHLYNAKTFYSLHEAHRLASENGALVLPWREAKVLEST